MRKHGVFFILKCKAHLTYIFLYAILQLRNVKRALPKRTGGKMLNKRTRQYIGLFSAIIAYYIIHEGAHLLYALSIGVFKQINFIGLGVQIDVYRELMTDTQLGIFCILGSIATAITAYLFIALISRIGKRQSKVFKACTYYITIALLILDPIYLSILCGFVGGGDMNGIVMIVPEGVARIVYGILLVVHVLLIFKVLIPKYKVAFEED